MNGNFDKQAFDGFCDHVRKGYKELDKLHERYKLAFTMNPESKARYVSGYRATVGEATIKEAECTHTECSQLSCCVSQIAWPEVYILFRPETRLTSNNYLIIIHSSLSLNMHFRTRDPASNSMRGHRARGSVAGSDRHGGRLDRQLA